MLQQPQCLHAFATCPIAQTTRAPCRHNVHTQNGRQITSWKEQTHFRCNAVAEAEVEAAETETDGLEIEDLNNKDFRAAFDNLLERTKTRFDVGDKVRGTVERCLPVSVARIMILLSLYITSIIEDLWCCKLSKIAHCAVADCNDAQEYLR